MTMSITTSIEARTCCLFAWLLAAKIEVGLGTIVILRTPSRISSPPLACRLLNEKLAIRPARRAQLSRSVRHAMAGRAFVGLGRAEARRVHDRLRQCSTSFYACEV